MITIDHTGCVICVGCASVCPFGAVELVGTRMKTYSEKCTDCGLCIKACPANVITLHKGIKDVKDLPAEARKKL
ncbi:MAG: 4Fe-4S binding protein [Candidatus ainarchaeum sp.]|nr:4Fe-4S binding protein [Candidatus ainarchaeum sp.]